jgi:hypothetical protein
MERALRTCIAVSLVLMGLHFSINHAFADAQIHEWIGDYNMNHDGLVGTLKISDSKVDCTTSQWCHLVLSYTDSNGNRYNGSIQSIDDRWQHMVFFVSFPQNQQKFDAYLFSWDKSKVAGLTYWGGRTFGFYALKK